MRTLASSKPSAQSSSSSSKADNTGAPNSLRALMRSFVKWARYGTAKRSIFLRKSVKKAIITLVEALETSGEWQDFFEFHRQLLQDKGIRPRLENIVFDVECIVSKEAVEAVERELKTVRGIPRHDLQATLTGIMLVLRYRLPWKALPRELGHYKTIYGFYHRYSAMERWTKIMYILIKDCNKLDTSIISIDSTCCKCEREASSLYTKDKGGDRLIGHTRGGYNSKIHLVCDKNGLPFYVKITAGNVSDIKVGYQILEELADLEVKGALLADKGYDSKRFRTRAQELGFKPYIPHRKFTKAKKKRLENQQLYREISRLADKTDEQISPEELEKLFRSYKKADIAAMALRAVRNRSRRNEKSYSRGAAFIPEEEKSSTGDPYDPELNEVNAAIYDHRNIVERTIGRLKNIKNISLRKDRAAHIYRSTVAFGIMFTFFLS